MKILPFQESVETWKLELELNLFSTALDFAQESDLVEMCFVIGAEVQ